VISGLPCTVRGMLVQFVILYSSCTPYASKKGGSGTRGSLTREGASFLTRWHAFDVSHPNEFALFISSFLFARMRTPTIALQIRDISHSNQCAVLPEPWLFPLAEDFSD
jgi:hypothetical protein